MGNYSQEFYIKQLPELEAVLWKKLDERCPQRSNQTLADCVNAFFDFYYTTSAFDFFTKDLIEKDDLHLVIWIDENDKFIRLQRTLTCNWEFDDLFSIEDYQIRFTLHFKNSISQEQLRSRYAIEQFEKGKFQTMGSAVPFEDFKNSIYNLPFLQKHLNEIPAWKTILLNANI